MCGTQIKGCLEYDLQPPQEWKKDATGIYSFPAKVQGDGVRQYQKKLGNSFRSVDRKVFSFNDKKVGEKLGIWEFTHRSGAVICWRWWGFCFVFVFSAWQPVDSTAVLICRQYSCRMKALNWDRFSEFGVFYLSVWICPKNNINGCDAAPASASDAHLIPGTGLTGKGGIVICRYLFILDTSS